MLVRSATIDFNSDRSEIRDRDRHNDKRSLSTYDEASSHKHQLKLTPLVEAGAKAEAEAAKARTAAAEIFMVRRLMMILARWIRKLYTSRLLH